MNLRKTFCLALVALMSMGTMFAQTSSLRSRHSDAHKQLLANHTKSKDQIKLIEKNSFIDLTGDIEPEIDIYTEGWNSKKVNPFKESDVPNKKVLNVTGYAMPLKNIRVTSNYGYRPRFGRMHKGVDLGLKTNDTIYAAYDGKVRLTNYEPNGYGNYVILRHPNELETVYGHMNKFLVKPNQTVKAGQPIGLGGNTGRSTGPHLHFETRYMGYAINPAAIFDFQNKTIHTDYYTFSKSTYTQPRSYSPSRELANAKTNESNHYKSGSSPATYTVKEGDSLASIARSYGLSATTLKKLNDITDSNIKVGQTLKLK